jgi:hypothetical protein
VGLTIHEDGKGYAAHEAESMLLGAVAFLIYAALASWILRRGRLSALVTSVVLMPVWLGLAIGLRLLMGKS